jgi:ribosome-binding protein aMBF1 (putative translation factor)
MGKMNPMATKTSKKQKAATAKPKPAVSPQGRTAREAAAERAARSEGYREARDEYATIRELRKKNWIAAHIRERRFELDMTQQQVADAANTSHSYISRVEKGDHLPTLSVLKRILAVLDEELLIAIVERAEDGEEPEREVAPVPELAAA